MGFIVASVLLIIDFSQLFSFSCFVFNVARTKLITVWVKSENSQLTTYVAGVSSCLIFNNWQVTPLQKDSASCESSLSLCPFWQVNWSVKHPAGRINYYWSDLISYCCPFAGKAVNFLEVSVHKKLCTATTDNTFGTNNSFIQSFLEQKTLFLLKKKPLMLLFSFV